MKDIIKQLEAEQALTAIWFEDTLSPSVNLLKLKTILYDMLAETELYIGKNGVTTGSTKALTRLNNMLALCDKLAVVVNQNNTLQLSSQHVLRVLNLKNIENIELKSQIEAVEKAWKAE